MDNRFFIESVKCDLSSLVGPREGSAFAEIQYVKNGERKYLSLFESDDEPYFFLSEESMYEMFGNMALEDLINLGSALIDEFEGIPLGEYEELILTLDDQLDNPASPLLEYIIGVIRSPEDELEEMLQMGIGKYADEIVMVDEDGFEFNVDDKESLYKERLYVESTLEFPHIFMGVDADAMRRRKKDVKIARYLTEEDYDTWKEEFLLSKLDEVKDEKLMTASVVVEEKGSFLNTIKESQVETFKHMIDDLDHAEISEIRVATEEERKIYIAQNLTLRS